MSYLLKHFFESQTILVTVAQIEGVEGVKEVKMEIPSLMIDLHLLVVQKSLVHQ
jgi:hypothetical protein